MTQRFREFSPGLFQMLFFFVAASLAPSAWAQWNPAQGQWGKEDPRDLRVMTWNVKDALCSTNDKQEGLNNWSGLAVIIASMQPDVLILQETGDNVGNGTGGFQDPPAWVQAAGVMLFEGGEDTFNGGAEVTSFVQKYTPDYNLPHKFVSLESDGFNRNVIFSRFPLADLNGDGDAQAGDIPFISPDEYAPGGDGGIRGFAFVEIDLPEGSYAGDLVVGGAHLKAGGDRSDLDARLEAAQNVAYYVDFLYNGAGQGVPDPNDAIGDSPPVEQVLDADTPVVLAGDWNEDELTNGRKGPAAWLVEAEFSPGDDGTDRDRSDSVFDDARDVFTNERGTFGGGPSKLDYIAWQDSIAELRRAWLFDTATLPAGAETDAMEQFPGFSPLLSNVATICR